MNTFVSDLAVGHTAEKAIRDELAYWGIPTAGTTGKNDVDFFLPDGTACEAKLDIFSLRTGSACIEYPSIRRPVDLFFHTLCYTKVFTAEQYNQLYNRGKIASVGDNDYHARLIPKFEFENSGTFLDQWIKAQRQ